MPTNSTTRTIYARIVSLLKTKKRAAGKPAALTAGTKLQAGVKMDSETQKNQANQDVTAQNKKDDAGMGAPKLVYRFGAGKADGSADMKNLLGGKGANLAEMANLGLPVPPGFTITTEVCTAYYANGKKLPEGLHADVRDAVAQIGTAVGAGLGDAQNPLLVSIRSGSRASMPGMMDTILNLGLNDATVEGLAVRSGNRRFAYDSYRRFITMYSNVVLDIKHHDFEEILDHYKHQNGYDLDTDLTDEDWQTIIAGYKQMVQAKLGKPFPQDINEQLWGAIGAVFDSWNNPRAIKYRQLNNLPESWGTAVNVQAMVFGNRGETSATGVAFTRNPATGDKRLYGEFLVNAQGEDVVAGIRTPQSITEEARIESGSDKPSLEAVMPEAFAEFKRHLRDAGAALPRHAGRGVHDPGRQAVDAPVPQRQAHDPGGAEGCDRHGARGAHHQGGGRNAHRGGAARPNPAPDHRPGRRSQGHHDGASRLARRRMRPDRVLAGRRREA